MTEQSETVGTPKEAHTMSPEKIKNIEGLDLIHNDELKSELLQVLSRCRESAVDIENLHQSWCKFPVKILEKLKDDKFAGIRIKQGSDLSKAPEAFFRDVVLSADRINKMMQTEGKEKTKVHVFAEAAYYLCLAGELEIERAYSHSRQEFECDEDGFLVIEVHKGAFNSASICLDVAADNHNVDKQMGRSLSHDMFMEYLQMMKKPIEKK